MENREEDGQALADEGRAGVWVRFAILQRRAVPLESGRIIADDEPFSLLHNVGLLERASLIHRHAHTHEKAFLSPHPHVHVREP